MVNWIRTVDKMNRWELEALSTDVLPVVDAFGDRLGDGSSVFLTDTQELKVFEYESATWIPNN